MDEPCWRGAVDAKGRPHGRGTLLLGKRARYEGHMRHGLRNGLGTLYVEEEASDEDEDEDASKEEPLLSVLRVRWRADLPDGPGCFLEPGGGSLHGTWLEGALSGPAHECHADGSLRFCGSFSGGVRAGFGVELRADGGAFAGTWRDGQLHGAYCAFLYPCSNGSALVGEWREGACRKVQTFTGAVAMEARTAGVLSALPALPEAARHPALRQLLLMAREAAAAEAASKRGCGARAAAEALRSVLCVMNGQAAAAAGDHPPRHADPRDADPRDADPYEAARVSEAASRIPGAGRGLFARRPLAGGEIAAFLAGRLLEADEAADADADAEAEQTDGELPQVPPSVDADWCPPLDSDGPSPSWLLLAPNLRDQPPTLGWRANHAGWRANCELTPFEHPLHGSIGCVRTLGAVEAGAELTLNYKQLAWLPARRRPRWYQTILDARSEDGYYAHLQATPPLELLSLASAASESAVRVVQHGPWRVLWVGKVEQGMTFHSEARTDPPPSAGGGVPSEAAERAEASRSLLAQVVGFDYQRTLVAAAASLLDIHVPKEPFPKDFIGFAAGPLGSILLVGLGAGSCAAALHALSDGRYRINVVEYDEAVVEAAARAHGVSGGGADYGRVNKGGAIHVALDDAKSYVHVQAREYRNRTWPPVRCVLLDAYDGKGDVPAHLQEAAFVASLAKLMRKGKGELGGGLVLANLWNGSVAARASCDAFAKLLEETIGPVFSMRVVGHEDNIVLLSAVPLVGAGAAFCREEVFRQQLQKAAHEAVALQGAALMEPALAETFRANAATFERYHFRS